MIKDHTLPQHETDEKLRISGMDCADCAVSIERSLRQLPGVHSAAVNFGAATADVSYEPDATTHDAIARRIGELGYRVEEARPAGDLGFILEGMDCADCARTIEKAVANLPGVRSATVNFGAARLSVSPGDGDRPGLMTAIERTVGQAGYRATPVEERARLAQQPFWRRDRRALTTLVGGFAALAALVLSIFHAPSVLIDGLFAATMVVSGFGFARAGLLAARAGRADMNLLMTIAALGAAALGDWPEAGTVVLLFAFGGTLQAYTLEKTRGAIRALMQLSPETALVRRQAGEPGEREMRVPIEEVQPGETVLVRPGERLPLDGVILAGESSVDQSPITGESIPVEVESGSEVYAGTINGPGAFAMRSLHASSDTTLARIIHLVEEAQSRRAPSQQFVDRFAAIYTPVVLAGAVLVATVPTLLFAQPFAEWFYRALVLLVVACPCALVISTPVSLVAAIGAATRRGVLIKGGAILETLGQVRALAFDKTGTLTEGRPHVANVYPLNGTGSADLLRLAAAVEIRSEHLLARAVVHAARESGGNGASIPVATGFMSYPGMGAAAQVDGRTIFAGTSRFFSQQGLPLDGAASVLGQIEALGHSAVLVGTRESLLGAISLADAPRSGAREAIDRLHRSGIEHIAMLTGDNERTASAIAREVGVDDYEADLLPEQKVAAVERLVSRYGKVAMAGDGVNDAPALAAASVGIAMGTAGTDVALEVAGVALMGDDLSRLDYAVLLSRKTLRVIRANVGLSLAVKALALGLAAAGALPLWGAILADMGVSLLVTLNGMRLLTYK